MSLPMAPQFVLLFEQEFLEAFCKLETREQQRVEKALGLLAQNPRHPSLSTHILRGRSGKYLSVGGEHLFIAYASQGKGALRIIFEYGPQPGQIALHTCGPHDETEKR